MLTKSFVTALEAENGPIFWIQKLTSTQLTQLDHLSRAILKISVNSSTPQIQLTLRILRHKLALKQSSASIDGIAKSTFQALRSYYAVTQSDKEAYEICKEVLAPILDQLKSTQEVAKIINFMGILARKAGLMGDALKWNDLGLRTCSIEEKCFNAQFLLRNVGIIYSLSSEELSIFLLSRTNEMP